MRHADFAIKSKPGVCQANGSSALGTAVLYVDHALLHVLLKQTTRRGAGDVLAPRYFINLVGRFLHGTETCADSGIPLEGAHYLRRRGSQERYGQRCTDAPGAILQA